MLSGNSDILLKTEMTFYPTLGPKPGVFCPPVVFQKRDLLAVRHGEAIFWSLIPVHIIDPVGAIVVSGDDDAANQKLTALFLEVLLVLLIHGVPLGRKEDLDPRVHTQKYV